MNLNEFSDEQMMRSIKNGEVSAFKNLYERHGARVNGFCFKMLRDEALAEEVTQETFWRIWRNADSFHKQRGTFQNWMFGIARNLSIDILRRQKVHLEPLQGGHPDREGPAQKLASHHDVTEVAWSSLQEEQVHLALAELPAEQRDVIDWIYFQGKTRREIAREMEIPFGTINTRARLALDKLRRALQANGYGLEEL